MKNGKHYHQRLSGIQVCIIPTTITRPYGYILYSLHSWLDNGSLAMLSLFEAQKWGQKFCQSKVNNMSRPEAIHMLFFAWNTDGVDNQGS